jgi:hypothetical protein
MQSLESQVLCSYGAGLENVVALAIRALAIKVLAADALAAPTALIALAEKTKATTALASKVLQAIAIAVQTALVVPAAEKNTNSEKFAHSFVGFLRIYWFGGFFFFSVTRT